VQHLLAVRALPSLLADQPKLEASLRARFPYLDPLNHLQVRAATPCLACEVCCYCARGDPFTSPPPQVELLKEYRRGEASERTVRGIHLTINGLSAGLRNSG
jgi:phosphoenolpyruvate carboxylase